MFETFSVDADEVLTSSFEVVAVSSTEVYFIKTGPSGPEKK